MENRSVTTTSRAIESEDLPGAAKATPSIGKGSLRSRVIRGSFWTLAGFGSGQVVRLGGNIVLARLLFPGAFGVMALVNIFVQGLTMFSDIGIGPSIIQSKRGDDPTFLNTAWTIQVIRGVVLWVVSCLIAWPVAGFYQNPELRILIPVAGLIAIISGFNSTSLFTHNRHLMLGKLTGVLFSSQTIAVVAMIAWAWQWPTVWALVIGALLGGVVKMGLSHAVLPGCGNRLLWNREASKELFGFGKWIFLSTLITFLALQYDRLALGRLISLEMLGVYAIAATLCRMPMRIGTRLANAVLLPALSRRAQIDREEFADKVRRARGMVLPINLLAVLSIVLGAPMFFSYLYDDRYADASWIAQLLSITIWFTILMDSSDRALVALGDTRSMARGKLYKCIVMAVGSSVGYLSAGLPGFILGVAVGAMAGQIVVELAMAKNGIGIVRQDIVYTLTALGLGVVGVYVPRLISLYLPGPWEPAVVPIIAVAMLTPLGIWVVRRTLRETRRRT